MGAALETTPPEAAPAYVLDGQSLDVGAVAAIARDLGRRVEVAEAARARVRAGRRQIDDIVARYRADYDAYERGERASRPVQDYGLTTGFGEFKDLPVSPADLDRLQQNLLRSHAVGLGDNADPDDGANYFPPDVVRASILIRVNTFLRGHSGVREELLDTLLAMLHAGIVPLVPTRGSMGSSGDLCPLAHLFGVLVGEGRYVRVQSDDRRLPIERAVPAARLAEDLAEELGGGPAADLGGGPAADLGGHLAADRGGHLAADLDGPPATPVVKPVIKEGLALINGATVSTALLALATHDAASLAATADAAAALSLEAMCGCARAFDVKVHAARGQLGQIASARRIRGQLAGSSLLDGAGAVQDAYSLRCAPVVHGASLDAIGHVEAIVRREMNAATDNPLFFEGEPWDVQLAANWPEGYDGRQRASYSAGNFHGQPIALAADYLAMAVAELANISERRCQLLLDGHHNRNLPANLVPRRGLNSGLMLGQYAAASLVAENKVLAHPASVDSIPTAANIEDHVAVATTAARKSRLIVQNAQGVLAIELMTAAQAVDWRVGMELSPTPWPKEADDRPAIPDDGWEAIEREARRFEKATEAGQRSRIGGRLGEGSRRVYNLVRSIVEPLVEDRYLSGDVAAVRALVEEGCFAELLAATAEESPTTEDPRITEERSTKEKPAGQEGEKT